ncbi:hypothetical protein BDV95DRAFT_655577 [Massariosphaeria phaeospora]|uniref:Uncharacterized protein n=1 Tax=Massariosphaeria phaeospora TaxID=100035 RepID=A0A7C8M121_9PLEO|nr:hypothetical protein BDV95DRAFT_655577 [Massariosphaeria phaeospora]
MASPGLIVAIIFAGLFGTVILWLGVYYLYRYIHQSCLELDHWFHFLNREHEDYQKEKGEKGEKSGSGGSGVSPALRLRSSRQSRSDNSRSKRRHTSPRDSLRERKLAGEVERSVQTPPRYRGGQGYHPPQQRLTSGEAQEYHPPMGWQQRLTDGEVQYPVEPMAMPMEREIASPVGRPGPGGSYAFGNPLGYGYQAGAPGYEHQYVGHYEEPPVQSQVEEQTMTEPVTTVPEPRAESEPIQIDFIHIADKLPDWYLEKKQKHQPPVQPDAATGDNSDAESEIQQIPRAFIPRAAPRAAFQFPQYPQFQSRLWEAGPTSYPKQWTNQAGEGQISARYAPYETANGERRTLRNADRRRPAPSFRVPRAPMYERRGEHRPSRRRPQNRPQNRPRSEPQFDDMGNEREQPILESGTNEQPRDHESEVRGEGQEANEENMPGQENNAEPETEPEPEEEQQERSEHEAEKEPEQTAEPDVEPELAGDAPPERQPILLGMTPPVSEAEQPQMPPSPPHSEGPAPSSPRSEVPDCPASPSPSTLISSLHRSHVIHQHSNHGSRQPSQSGSERGPSHSIQISDRESQAHGSTAERASNRTTSPVVAAQGGSDILSTLNGWETDRAHG